MIVVGIMTMTLCDWWTLKIITSSTNVIVAWYTVIMFLWFFVWMKNDHGLVRKLARDVRKFVKNVISSLTIFPKVMFSNRSNKKHVLATQENMSTPVERSDPLQLFSGEEIILWSRYEKPILNKSDDYLGLYDWADRIANILWQSNTEGSCSIGLQGGWGSGKTSGHFYKSAISIEFSRRVIFLHSKLFFMRHLRQKRLSAVRVFCLVCRIAVIFMTPARSVSVISTF